MLILAACTDAMQMCCDMSPFLKIVSLLITIIQFSVPAVLIILGAIDMFKVVAKGDEKTSSDVTKTFGKRLLYGLLIFIVPYLVRTILGLVGNTVPNGEDNLPDILAWVECFNNIGNNSYCKSCNDIYESDNPSGNDNNGNNDNNDNGSAGDTSSTNNKKTCYGWAEYVCSDTKEISDIRNLLKNGDYYSITAISELKYSNNYCEVSVTISSGQASSSSFCELELPSILGASFESKSSNICKFSYTPTIERKYSNNLSVPKSNKSNVKDGNVDIYSCDSTQECSSWCEGPTSYTHLD